MCSRSCVPHPGAPARLINVSWSVLSSEHRDEALVATHAQDSSMGVLYFELPVVKTLIRNNNLQLQKKKGSMMMILMVFKNHGPVHKHR